MKYLLTATNKFFNEMILLKKCFHINKINHYFNFNNTLKKTKYLTKIKKI